MAEITASFGKADTISSLNELIRLNVDIISSLELALESASSPDFIEGLRDIVEMHERHIELLGEAVWQLGGMPVKEQDWRHWITEGRVFLGKLRGDRGLLEAVHAEEEELREVYAHRIGQLKTIHEAADAIRQALDEGLPVFQALETVVERERP